MATFSSTKDSIRQKYIELLNKNLQNIKLSKQIEKQLYNSSINLSKDKYIQRRWSNPVFKKLYISKIRSFYCNISETSYVKNTHFKQKILDGVIKVDEISNLSVYDIYPENWSEH